MSKLESIKMIAKENQALFWLYKEIKKIGIIHAYEWTLKKNKEGQVERAKAQMVVSWPEKPLYGDPKNVITKVIKKGQPIVVSPKLTEKTNVILSSYK